MICQERYGHCSGVTSILVQQYEPCCHGFDTSLLVPVECAQVAAKTSLYLCPCHHSVNDASLNDHTYVGLLWRVSKLLLGVVFVPDTSYSHNCVPCKHMVLHAIIE